MRRTPTDWRGVWACAGVSAFAGVLLTLVPLGGAFWRTSYDLPVLNSSPAKITNVLLVYVDDESLRALNARPDGTLDRRWHAELLERLRADQAPVVVFDLAFTKAVENDLGDQAFATALRKHGRTVLAAVQEIESWGAAEKRTLRPPAEMFATNAFAVGTASFEVDTDGVVRRMSRDEHSLSWMALKAAEAFPRQLEDAADHERWLRYYLAKNVRGSAFESISLQSALASNGVPRGFFREKIVFVGTRRDVGPAGELRDRFATPFSVWDERHAPLPGAVLHATAFANIARGEWLAPFSRGWATMVNVLLAIGAAALLCPRRRRVAVALFLAATAVVTILGFIVQQRLRYVTPWLIPVAVQFPIALVWVLGRNSNLPGKPEVFISYRRTEGEGSGYALGLYHALRARGVESYWDMASLESGAWKEQLQFHIDEVPNFILLVTKGSLNPDRLNRTDGKDDMFRWEIERAHRRKKNIIIVLIDGAKIPPRAEPLPPGLAFLQDQNRQPQTWTYRHDDAMRLADIVWVRLHRRGRIWQILRAGSGRRSPTDDET